MSSIQQGVPKVENRHACTVEWMQLELRITQLFRENSYMLKIYK